ncbi:hypothetical protein [Oceanicoccus sp. KOV_DT_Chl]|uniref:hypothetical protein n=1 Tax=Oceanicoccus sp. KOV_DT_Chl TaxID=1904639 RepID=UPI000C7DA03B|nr:hypothetical protein [Oceanicoccus sp. KOV_DT_Chl]
MKKLFIWLYKAIKDSFFLGTIGILIFGGVSYYEVLSGIRSDIQQATATANENMSLTLDAFKLSLDRMNNEISSLKDLSGIKRLEQSQNRLEFAHKILDLIQESGATIGTDGLFGSEIDKPVHAKKWAASARDEARLMAYKSRDNNEVIWALATTITKQDWLMQFGQADPVPMYEWLNNQSILASNGVSSKGAGDDNAASVL